jgi:hypothetical protein
MGLVLAACGGGNSVDLGVKGSKQLSELDQQESCDLVKGFFDNNEELFELGCIVAGQGMGLASPGDFTAACETARDACIDDFSFGDDEELVCEDVQNNLPATCTATVSDLESCLSDVLAAYDAIQQAGCNEQVDLSELEALNTEELPASCAPFQEESCGGFI